MKRDKIFLFTIITVILVLVIGTILRGEKEKSTIENRKLEDFSKFSVESFLSAEFQTNTENALTDQILLGGTFKLKYNSLKSITMDLVVKGMLGFQDVMWNTQNNSDKINSEYTTFQAVLLPFGNNLAKMKETDYIVKFKTSEEWPDKEFEVTANSYNKLVKDFPEISFSCYYIETDRDVDFIKGEIRHDLVENFYDKLDEPIKKGVLYINTLEDYQNHFYKTEDHWNSEGQLQGYKDIIKLLKAENEEPLEIETVPIEGLKFYGTKAREAGNFSIYDKFSILWCELPEHEVFVNGVKSNYGTKENYLDGDFSNEVGVGHYEIANGYNSSLVEYRFNQTEKDNLLVFAPSYSNPINAFIAAHFNNTYFIDLRDYENVYNETFKFNKFVDKYEIDKVLFLGYGGFYSSSTFLISE